MKKPIIIWVASNAGGVGKTTLTIHLGYKLAHYGIKTLIVDLDTNGSLARFCGLDVPIVSEESSAALFSRQFNGNYPIIFPNWKSSSAQGLGLLLGGDIMVSVAMDLPSRTAKEYVLQRALKKFPPSADVVLIDSPASLDVLSYCALAAATHILVPTPMSIKMAGVNLLIQNIRVHIDELGLDPAPEFLGGVPMKVAKNADQQLFSAEIEEVLGQQGIPCFPLIRENKHYENAANRGVAPLYLYRPGSDASKDFEPIVKAVRKLVK